jgi:hypothetical protein
MNKELASNPVVIIDEITKDILKDVQAQRFERLINFIATHKNTFVMCAIQSLTNIPPKCRRGFNNFAIWKQADSALNNMIANRCGLEKRHMDALFDLCETPKEFIYIDLDRHRDDQLFIRSNFINEILYEK